MAPHFTEENSYFGEKNGSPRFPPDPAFSTRPRTPYPGTPYPVPRPRVFHLALSKIHSRKNIEPFHASRKITKILSCSRINQGDHVLRINKKRFHGLIIQLKCTKKFLTLLSSLQLTFFLKYSKKAPKVRKGLANADSKNAISTWRTASVCHACQMSYQS